MRRLKKITPKRIRSWAPCTEWADGDRIEVAFRANKLRSAAPLQIAPCKDISAEDRLWLLLREEIIPARELRLLACKWAERALRADRKAGREPDERSWNAVSVARRFANGKATSEELEAAREAAWLAAWWAAWEAAREAAREAAWKAAWKAAREAQLRDVIRTLETLDTD